MNVHIARALSAGFIAATLGSAAWFGVAIGSADPFDQREFPCQEDEVLGYAPGFGADRVGCIHIDQISVAHGVAAADGGVPGR